MDKQILEYKVFSSSSSSSLKDVLILSQTKLEVVILQSYFHGITFQTYNQVSIYNIMHTNELINFLLCFFVCFIIWQFRNEISIPNEYLPPNRSMSIFFFGTHRS